MVVGISGSECVTNFNESDFEIPADLAQKLTQTVGNLTVLPGIASEAVQKMRDPECSSLHATKIIERDPKLTTDLLKLANSAIFCSGQETSSLHQAITRIGFDNCRNLILVSSLSSALQAMPIEQHWIREQLAQHGLVTAMISQEINLALRCGFKGEEFTVSILHDVGRLLIAATFPNEFEAIDPLDFEEASLSPIELERSVLGTDHCEIGAWFAAKSCLPSELVDAIRTHHSTALAKNPRLSTLVAAADHIANHLQVNETIDDYELFNNSPLTELLNVMGLSPDCLLNNSDPEVLSKARLNVAFENAIQMLSHA